jgi:hypothetical protein
MERESIDANGASAEADASVVLKRVIRLSSLPALAGGLWRFAVLPSFLSNSITFYLYKSTNYKQTYQY